MYFPLADPLTASGINIRFVSLPGFFKNDELPSDERMTGIDVWTPHFNSAGLFQNRLKMFYCAYHSLIPAWRKYLGQFNGGAVVVAMDGAPIQRMLLNSAKDMGFTRITMQDGYFVSVPTKYGWKLENKKRLLMKKLISLTPLRRFISLGYGTATDYCGLYGTIVRESFCKNKVFSWEQASVIGSSRFAVFRKRVSQFGIEKGSGEIKVLCLPSTFPMYRDNKLDEAQDSALKWTCKTIKKLRNIGKLDISINIKVKRGYNHLMPRYSKLFNEPYVNILSGDRSLERLFAESNAIVTMGSTAALEAAVCGRPVIQVMPPYLYDRYIKISGLPLARNESDVHNLLEKALLNPDEYVKNFYAEASKELADINPEWDSIEKTTDWLKEIVRKS